LLSAWQVHPQAAWLVVAVDLALLDAATLSALIEGRRVDAMATAFCHKDGTIEPLCTIWEPTAQRLIAERLARGDASLRRCLETADVELLAAPQAAVLTSIDSRAEHDALYARLTGR
jgi:molybdopterin-guanine dinucleotide biosynthesis protein A